MAESYVLATTALHGPDGIRVDVDEEVPAAWGEEYIAHLIETKGARRSNKKPTTTARPAKKTVDGKGTGRRAARKGQARK